jgi:hypothetical protein
MPMGNSASLGGTGFSTLVDVIAMLDPDRLVGVQMTPLRRHVKEPMGVGDTNRWN